VIFLLVNRGWILRVGFGWADLAEQPSHGLFIPTHLLGACMRYFSCDKIFQWHNKANIVNYTNA
jgi:hypothetical protein